MFSEMERRFTFCQIFWLKIGYDTAKDKRKHTRGTSVTYLVNVLRHGFYANEVRSTAARIERRIFDR